jgi:hypothetical protein
LRLDELSNMHSANIYSDYFGGGWNSISLLAGVAITA